MFAPLEIHAAIGDRERANQLAAEIDARPAGPMLLLITFYSCACGVAFDMESVPNFSARVQESGGVECPLHLRERRGHSATEHALEELGAEDRCDGRLQRPRGDDVSK